MWILPLIGYSGIALGFSFLTLSIASGLYYLSELVEEYTVIAKKFLTHMIYVVIGFQALLYIIDGFPISLSALGIFTHFMYLKNLRKFPLVRITDPIFIFSCVIINHYVWFSYFSSVSFASTPFSRYETLPSPTFVEMSSFFGICVWLVPFALFVSLSASDNVLPTIGSEVPCIPNTNEKGKRHGLVKVAVDSVRERIAEMGVMAGWWKAERNF